MEPEETPPGTRLFSDKPRQLGLFSLVREYIRSIGQAAVKESRTQVAFARRRQFAWVWLPQPWERKRPPGSIVLSFSLPRRVTDPRIAQAIEPYPGRWMHHVIIAGEPDFDDEVRG